MTDPWDLGRSLWAASGPPAPATPPLDGGRHAEVVVLEAREPGWGASGHPG